jgi:hypothetical protein
MKYIPLFILLFTNFTSIAQCDDDRYKTEIFSEVLTDTDVLYGSNTNIYNIEEELYMDVYQPTGDTATQRALIIFAHGGSFVIGDKADEGMVLIGSDFAKMGYVTASINYRLGLTTNLILEFPDSIDAYAAVVRGLHDFKAAIRWFKKDVAEGDNQYNIDPNKVLIAGFSAGGFIVLHQAYLDEESEWPSFDESVLGVDGGIDGNSGNPGYDTEFIGGLNVAGAIGDTSWIHTGDEPMISSHGTEDDVVPYGTALLSFTLGALTIDISIVSGSSSVHEQLDNVGVPNCFTSWEGQGHVPEADLGPYYDTTFVKTRNFFASLLCNEEINCEYEDLVSGINESVSLNSLHVYPNPFNESITLSTDEFQTIKSVELYNLNGQLIKQWNTYQSKLNVAELEKGIYLLKVRWVNNESNVFKLIK